MTVIMRRNEYKIQKKMIQHPSKLNATEEK